MKRKTGAKSATEAPKPAPSTAAEGDGVAIPEAKGSSLDPEESPKAGVSCVKRLPAYLQLLRLLQAEGHEYVSGTVLATVHHLESVIVRKDLAVTGITGTPRIGFRVDELILAIERFLGWDSQTKAVLVGVGNLGSALLGYRGFEALGLHIVGAFDQDPKKLGQWVHDRRVQSVDKLVGFVRRDDIRLGVLAVPADVAQIAADLMVEAGIRGIWNFTSVKLKLPPEVVTQKEDLAEGLAVLSHRLRSLGR